MVQRDPHLANPQGLRPQSCLRRHPPQGGTPLDSACTIAGSSPLQGSTQGPSEWEDLWQSPVTTRVSPHSRDTPSPGGGHGGAGGTDPLHPLPRAGGDAPGNADGEVRPHMCSGGGPRGYLGRARAHAVLPRSGKGTVCTSIARTGHSPFFWHHRISLHLTLPKPTPMVRYAECLPLHLFCFANHLVSYPFSGFHLLIYQFPLCFTIVLFYPCLCTLYSFLLFVPLFPFFL